MNISVFGLGYVGAVTATCLASKGNNVVGVDVNEQKVAIMNSGQTPIEEPGLNELIKITRNSGRLSATRDAREAVLSTDVSFVSVGTPSLPSGEANLSYVHSVFREILKFVHEKKSAHVIVLRSTVPPGTLSTLENSLTGLDVASYIHLGFNPEFLREGSAIRDFFDPPYTVIGTNDQVVRQTIQKIYSSFTGSIIITDPGVAEILKLVCNAWHATKIAFANEVGRIAGGLGINADSIMELVTRDTKLNISTAYMRPGFAYGGSCLPKDLASLRILAKLVNTDVPVIDAISRSNHAQISAVVQTILTENRGKVAVLGLAFKPDTDDLRESPAVVMVKQLIGEGCDVKIYDPCVMHARLLGTNLEYIRANLPHFESLLVSSVGDALNDADVIVVTHSTPEFSHALRTYVGKAKIIDPVGCMRQGVKETIEIGTP